MSVTMISILDRIGRLGRIEPCSMVSSFSIRNASCTCYLIFSTSVTYLYDKL